MPLAGHGIMDWSRQVLWLFLLRAALEMDIKSILPSRGSDSSPITLPNMSYLAPCEGFRREGMYCPVFGPHYLKLWTISHWCPYTKQLDIWINDRINAPMHLVSEWNREKYKVKEQSPSFWWEMWALPARVYFNETQIVFHSLCFPCDAGSWS